MHTTSEQTVREIALANPASIRLFEKLGIDYCCGGNLSLDAACVKANVPVESVIGSLLDTAQPFVQAVSNDAPLGEVTRTIVENHHGFVRSESPRIESLLDKVCSKHGRIHTELYEIKRLFAALTRALAEHMMKEEHILFPYIEALSYPTAPSACFGAVENLIAAMIADHEDAGATLAEMRRLSHEYTPPEGACPTFHALFHAIEGFERDLHRHVHLENNILFPRAIAAERNRNALLSAH